MQGLVFGDVLYNCMAYADYNIITILSTNANCLQCLIHVYAMYSDRRCMV